MRQSRLGQLLALATACLAGSVQSGWADGAGNNQSGSIERVQTAVWLESIEVYSLPWDPEWKAAAERGGFPGSFRKSAKEIEDLRASLLRRSKGLYLSAPDRATLDLRSKKLTEDLCAAADRLMPVTVVRAWDGVQRREVVVTFGRGQRALADRLAGGRPLLVVPGDSRPGDDFQAIRSTIIEIRPSSKVPTELLRAADAPEWVQTSRFGELDNSPLATPVTIVAEKDATPGSGVLTLRLPSPPKELEIDLHYPWYAEFQLFELAKDGRREKQVRFEGSNSLVALRATTSVGPASLWDTSKDLRWPVATGRVEVKSPQPWGYEAEIVKWYGVAPRHRLVPDTKRPNPNAKTGNSSKPHDSAGDAPLSLPNPPDPKTDPPSLPEEPKTPSVPESHI